jgi:hypothetical protein
MSNEATSKTCYSRRSPAPRSHNLIDAFRTAAHRRASVHPDSNPDFSGSAFCLLLLIVSAPAPYRAKTVFQQMGLLLKLAERVSETYEPGQIINQDI